MVGGKLVILGVILENTHAHVFQFSSTLVKRLAGSLFTKF